MSRINDYQMSFDLAALELAKRNPIEIAKLSGIETFKNKTSITITYYSRPIQINWTPITFHTLDKLPTLPLAEQALILHYLKNADGTPSTGEWITFREIKSGEFYWPAFVKRVKNPLISFFGNKPKILLNLVSKIGGKIENKIGDTSIVIQAFPQIKFLITLWDGDEDFPPDGNVLMDKNISHYFSTEDVAFAAGLLVYKMIAIAKKQIY